MFEKNKYFNSYNDLNNSDLNIREKSVKLVELLETILDNNDSVIPNDKYELKMFNIIEKKLNNNIKIIDKLNELSKLNSKEISTFSINDLENFSDNPSIFLNPSLRSEFQKNFLNPENYNMDNDNLKLLLSEIQKIFDEISNFSPIGTSEKNIVRSGSLTRMIERDNKNIENNSFSNI